MKVSIHQPNYIPNATYFKKMALCDTFIILDDVDYEHGGFTNRNKIRTVNGYDWLTIPVKHTGSPQLIKDVRIYQGEWPTKSPQQEHANKINENYKNAKNFEKVWPILNTHYYTMMHYLLELNVNLIMEFCRFFKINPKIVMSSEYGVKSKGSYRILDLCRLAHADVYISGMGGKNYLNEEHFKNNDIDIVYVIGEHKDYKQVYDPYISDLSELDFLMCGNY
jgi:hypothetical protein